MFYRAPHADYETVRRQAGARPQRSQRAFLADLEPAWTPRLIASQPDHAVDDLVFLGVQALMEQGR